MKVSLVLFTFNEINGMRAIMPLIKKEWYDELIIVDGGSTDGTIEYARENGYFIFVQKEKGPGAAFLEAFARVTGDIFIVFSPDGNSLPEKIPEAVQKMKEGFDVVIVSRYAQGAQSKDDTVISAFGNRLFTSLINFLFRTHISDSLVMYRAYRTECIKQLNISVKTSSFGTEILLRAVKRGCKIGEIPGDEPERIGGESKVMPLYNGLLELHMIFVEFFRGIFLRS